MKLKLTMFACITCFILNKTFSQTINKNYITTNGAVNAIVKKGDTIYIGGDFTRVGLPLNKLAKFNGDDMPDFNFPRLQSKSDAIGLETDGSGGYFLATRGCDCCSGQHNITYQYDGQSVTSPILHLLPDFSIDTQFSPVNINGCLSVIKRFGNSLYIGGNFTQVNGKNRSGLAAISTVSGAVQSWNTANSTTNIDHIEANKFFVTVTASGKYSVFDAVSGNLLPGILTTDGYVSSILIDSNNLYVGGGFNNIGYNVSGLATFSGDSLSLDSRFPNLISGFYINAIVDDDSGGYYAGGYFFSIGNQRLNNIAHILSDGSLDKSFHVSVNDEVSCLVKSNNVLYIGGSFNVINSTIRGYGAAIDLSTGQLTAFNPDADNYIQCIQPAGDTVYVGGYFNYLGNHRRNFAGAVTLSNAVTDWNPDPNQPVFQILSNKNNASLFISGEFSKVKNESIPYLAKVDAISGNPFNWSPAPNYPVYCLLQKDSNLFVGGGFTKISKVARNCLVAIDTATLTLTSFAPNPDGGVQALSEFNNQLYVAGYFTKIFSQPRPHVAGINLQNNTLTSFTANFDDERMRSILYSGDKVVVGGEFVNIKVAARKNLAVIDLKTNTLNPYNTGNRFSTGIEKFYRSNNDLFIAGNFSYNDGLLTCYNLLSLSLDSVKLTHRFNEYPDLSQYPYFRIDQLNVFHDKLFINGSFQKFINSNFNYVADRFNIASFDLNTSELTTDKFDADQEVINLVKNNNDNICVLGRFSTVKVKERRNLAAIDLNTRYISEWNPSPDGAVYTLALKDSLIYVGGSFGTINDSANAFLACLDAKTGYAKTWNWRPDDRVNTIAIQDSTMYVGGAFKKINNTKRNYTASIILNGNGSLSNWDPKPTPHVFAILPHGSEVYLGGFFTKVNDVNQKYLAKVNNTDGSLLNWRPKPDGFINTIIEVNNQIFAGGLFNNISGQKRTALAGFDISTGKLLSFDAGITLVQGSGIYSALAYGSKLYIGSNALDSLKGLHRGNLASIDTNGLYVSDFNPQPNGSVNSLMASDNKLFVGGSWNNIDGKDISNFAVFTLQPTKPSSKLHFENIQSTSVTVKWLRGDGENVLVSVEQDSNSSVPVNGKSYAANSAYGAGDSIATGSYVIYNSNSNVSDVNNLIPNHSYIFRVFEYNGTGKETNYLQQGFLQGKIKTPCPVYTIHIDSSSSLILCPGDSIKLSVPKGFSSYKWINGAIADYITTQTSGKYFVIIKDSNGCKFYSDTVVVNEKDCDAPSNLITTAITGSEAKLKWETTSCALKYNIEFKAAEDSVWQNFKVSSGKSYFVETGLISNTIYQWRIASICSNNTSIISSYSPIQSFTTINTLSSSITSNNTDVNGFDDISIKVFPNPVTNDAILDLRKLNSGVTLILTTVSGKFLWQSEKIYTPTTVIPMRMLNSSIYLLTVKNSKYIKTFKIIKQ